MAADREEEGFIYGDDNNNKNENNGGIIHSPKSLSLHSQDSVDDAKYSVPARKANVTPSTESHLEGKSSISSIPSSGGSKDNRFVHQNHSSSKNAESN